MIPAETQYETYDRKLLAIIKVFRIWGHYLKDCKHEILVFTNHNNPQRFMVIKNLSFYRVC